MNIKPFSSITFAHRVLKLAGFIVCLALFLHFSSLADGATITVDDDGNADHSSIQNAISSASEGDEIIVRQGTYHEKVEIDTTITMRGDGPESTFIIGRNSGSTVLVSAPDVTVSGFHITGSGSELRNGGIKVISSGNTIINVNCSGNGYGGIVISNAQHTMLSGVIATSNGNSGIELFQSPYTTIENCTLKQNPNGVNSAFSPDSSFSGLFVRSNNHGLKLYRSSRSSIDSSTIRGNSFGIFIHDCEQIVTDGSIFIGNTFAFAFELCHENVLQDLVFTHNTNGLIFWKTDNSQVRDCNFSVNEIGLRLDRSNNNSLQDNLFIDNPLGIRVEDNSKDNRVWNSLFAGNTEAINATGREGFPIEAKNNYWGNESGPHHETNNTHGTGDPVTDLVLFSPWFESYPVQINDDDDNFQLPFYLTVVLIFLFVLLFAVIKHDTPQRD